ncbi:MAG: AmmeMemoRadiSam system protein B [Acidimicrobiales bacterium]
MRPAAVAGSFYPGDRDTLMRAVRGLLRSVAAPEEDANPSPKALIAPHAGYVYSGSVAATAYAQFASLRGTVKRVLLAGPAHRVYLRGVAVPSVDAFDTPLGPVAVDAEARRLALEVEGVAVNDEAHAAEHSVEVHLPFILEALGPVLVLPMVVGGGPPTVLADILDRLWGGDETRIVISTDLSHYHDDATARRLDRATAGAIVARRWEDVGPQQACGAGPLRGLLLAAERRDLPVRLLELRTSADTVGPPDRVVGYGAFTVG